MDEANEDTGESLWNACAAVLNERPGPLLVKHVAKASGLSEEKVITMLIRETQNSRTKSVVFRYPPIPCAAIIELQE
jgi:hypothetical protein